MRVRRVGVVAGSSSFPRRRAVFHCRNPGFRSLCLGPGKLSGAVARRCFRCIGRGQSPNATVTIRNVGTNISSAAHTDDKGSYYFTGLRPTTYDVKVEATGFRSAERTGVVLAVDQESSLNFKLEVAGTLATISVTSHAAAA